MGIQHDPLDIAPFARRMLNRLIRNGRAPRSLARDDGLHDLRGAIADVKTEQIAQALLEGQRAVVSAMAMHEET